MANISEPSVLKLILQQIDLGKGKAKDLDKKVMGTFQWTKGQDSKGSYISYYDKWDLDVPLERENGFLGKPIEIYDRFYYDSETFHMIPDIKSKDNTQVLSKQNL